MTPTPDQFKQARKLLGYTQVQMGALCRVCKQQISYYEAGTRTCQEGTWTLVRVQLILRNILIPGVE